MANPVYQATIEELEAVLSPRVVSRSIKEGLNQVGRTPDTAGIEDMEQILKSQVYRQLQLTMPVTRAKEAVAEIIDRLRQVSAGDGLGSGAAEGGLVRQGQELERLQEALKPFNLYFEWPEVQKLRAQIQLLEADHSANRESPALLRGAVEQLQIVIQKREDQLVLQARDLGELQEALDEIRPLGGPKVRRLETLVNQVRTAQENRSLASGEADRAQRLVRDLRVALEADKAEKDKAPAAGAQQAPQQEPKAPGATSRAGVDPAAKITLSGIAPAAGAQGNASTSSLTPPARPAQQAPAQPAARAQVEPPLTEPLDVDSEEADLLAGEPPRLDEAATERVRKLDLNAEQRQLRQLETDFAEVLAYVPALSQRFAELRAELDEGRSVAQVLATLGSDMEGTKHALREDLKEELEEILAWVPKLHEEVDTTELVQAVRVTLGILSTALPSVADVEHGRRLAQVAREQDEELRQSERVHAQQLAEQDQLIGRLETTLLQSGTDDEAIRSDVERLRTEFQQLQHAHSQKTVVPEVVAAVRQAEERLARSLADRATERSDRRRARLSALRARIENLPVTDTLQDRTEAVRLEIERLLQAQENTDAVAALLIDEGPVVSGDADDSDIDALADVVEGIRTQLTASLRNRLMNMAEGAAELGDSQLIERIQRAVLGLERDEYPDIKQLQAAMRQEQEAQRLDQVDELHRLSLAAAQFAGEETPRAVQLRTLLAEAHEQLERGGLATHLPRAAELLDALKAETDQRLGSMPRRIDAALVELDKVAALNNEDVGTARRILMHLDSQREALPRLSPGLQLQLEASLSSAESLLEKLQGEYEATRLVADELVSGGLLDGVLGLFRTGADDGVSGSATATEASSHTGSPQAHIEAFSKEKGVMAVAILDGDGELVAGRLARVDGGLPALRAAATALTGAQRTGPTMVTVELESGAVMAGWFGNGDCIVLELADSSELAILANRLRRRLQDFADRA